LLREITAQSVREVGRLARGLRPGTLDDLGFPAAIEMHISELNRAQVLHVDLHMNGFSSRERMPKPVEQHLYRMVQEALTNVVKHARASAVSVVLRRNEGNVLAIVEDDGAGFDSPDPQRNGGPHDELKLASIRERASMVNGSISVESVAGHGTTLYIQVPLPREAS
ncbi:MAG TPA: ATP-binding protein, partial [Myxococcota bacterium]|nr:ATP-binding protein [Myxococcota bacterium]